MRPWTPFTAPFLQLTLTTASFQWLDKNGAFRSRIRFDDRFCYASGFAVNTVDRQLLACDRRNSMARLYDLSAVSAAELRRMRLD